MITADLRRAVVAAAGLAGADPLLRPGPAPGSYTTSLPFRLATPGQDSRQVASALAARLSGEPWIAAAAPAGPGYLTVTVTNDALTRLAVRIVRAGPACAASDALRGRTVPAPPPADLAAAPSWPRARATLAAELIPRLAAAAGATVPLAAERSVVPPPSPPPAADPQPGPVPQALDTGTPAAGPASGALDTGSPQLGPVAAAIEYAGADAVRFALARMPPTGADAGPQAAVIARHVLANPAYAVRYAHAAAVAVLRWATALGTRPAGFRPCLLAEPGELALLDALSWLPERVAMAARHGRPDEFAGYLEELAARTIDTMNTTGFTTMSSISSERLWLADAARTALAAGLGLLGIGAPGRL
ncbi:MAG: DALR anticodon-binding domain-containing protein [Streptosporangiaceae bacterium]